MGHGCVSRDIIFMAYAGLPLAYGVAGYAMWRAGVMFRMWKRAKDFYAESFPSLETKNRLTRGIERIV